MYVKILISNSHWNTAIPLFYCALLYCASQLVWGFLFCFVFQIEGLGQPWIKQVISTIFPTFADFVSQCHILVILSTFQTFSLLLYLFWWSVISDLWSYCWNYFGGTMNHTHIKWWTSWINVVCVLSAPPTRPSPSSSSPWASPFPETKPYWNEAN